jgi:hypothetical protein
MNQQEASSSQQVRLMMTPFSQNQNNEGKKVKKKI